MTNQEQIKQYEDAFDYLYKKCSRLNNGITTAEFAEYVGSTPEECHKWWKINKHKTHVSIHKNYVISQKWFTKEHQDESRKKAWKIINENMKKALDKRSCDAILQEQNKSKGGEKE